jgi:hypothetical protein
MGTARNGDVELAFDVEGDGPDLLLIAGTASERALWSLVRPALAQSWRTEAFCDAVTRFLAGVPA